MNELEKYIIKHRQDFDLFDPSPKVWEDIEKNLFDSKVNNRRSIPVRRLWIGIAAALTVAVGSFFFLQRSGSDVNNLDLEHINPGYALQIEYAQENINERQIQIMTLIEEHPTLAEKFRADLVALDITYEKLRANLFEEQNQEMLLQAMIANLKLQIEVLEDQLDLLKDLKEKIDENSGNII